MNPPPCPWELPDPATSEEGDVIAVGADLEPGTLLEAYGRGLFPMFLDDQRLLGWWSPDPRGIIPLDNLRIPRSLKRSLRRYEIRVNTAFQEVIRGCSCPDRPHGWITDEFIDAYTRLHRLGWAYSVESWTAEGELAGGLYGVSLGGFFAGESMFHRRRDASKVALVALVEILGTVDGALLDVQWCTPHLASLGAIEIPRRAYLRRLREAINLPVPPGLEGCGRLPDRGTHAPGI
ncbi:MAG: leucyl/phenylalanyl-tRNA--protein transferase [Actinobacteria bacterium]|nr:MAG: leucyl/phenylalanyl-tRNA--protein transferase [Actinomycetota bacterium]RIK04893.1 MAG: leucyl/phenylalanyl-tRNA--protein transferase [Acidobacteriota bacterium]